MISNTIPYPNPPSDPIKLSLAGFANYRSATESKRRKILTDFKYPNEDEPHAKILYYREARDAIRGYHKHQEHADLLKQKALELQRKGNSETNKPRKCRLLNNARCIASYAKFYDSNSLTLLDSFHHHLTINGVSISIAPELCGMSRNKRSLIKLDFAAKPQSNEFMRVACQLIYESSIDAGLPLPASRCMVRHIDSKTDFKKARAGARVMADIRATCMNIQAIWKTLQRPVLTT